jgi:UDP-glucose 4-epimerase
MGRILITGGAGFIGSHLTDELLARGHEVVVLDNLVNGSMENLAAAAGHSGFRFHKGDVTRLGDCRQAVEGLEVVFHLACLGVRHSLHSPIENHTVNAGGTLNMLEAARREGCKAFYYVSTSEIYGKVGSFPIRETDRPAPVTIYGASKLAGEYYAASYAQSFGLPTAVLRIFNNYGPRSHHEGDAGEIIPRSIVRALHGRPPIIFGDGSITRDFYYVMDTARALAELLNREAVIGQVMNIGTGVEITMKQLLETLLRVMGKSELGIEFLGDRPADVPRLWVDPSRFWAIVGYRAETDFETGLRNTVAYFRDKHQRHDLLAQVQDINWGDP